jgi:hypothetical protein
VNGQSTTYPRFDVSRKSISQICWWLGLQREEGAERKTGPKTVDLTTYLETKSCGKQCTTAPKSAAEFFFFSPLNI